MKRFIQTVAVAAFVVASMFCMTSKSSAASSRRSYGSKRHVEHKSHDDVKRHHSATDKKVATVPSCGRSSKKVSHSRPSSSSQRIQRFRAILSMLLERVKSRSSVGEHKKYVPRSSGYRSSGYRGRFSPRRSSVVAPRGSSRGYKGHSSHGRERSHK